MLDECTFAFAGHSHKGRGHAFHLLRLRKNSQGSTTRGIDSLRSTNWVRTSASGSSCCPICRMRPCSGPTERRVSAVKRQAFPLNRRRRGITRMTGCDRAWRLISAPSHAESIFKCIYIHVRRRPSNRCRGAPTCRAVRGSTQGNVRANGGSTFIRTRQRRADRLAFRLMEIGVLSAQLTAAVISLHY